MTPISVELSLALAVAAKPGVYAPLLGSGISRSAGVPTGAEVVRDLIEKVAAAAGEQASPDPEAWYTTMFERPPGYSTLLEALAGTPAERQALLRPYFEPSEEERDRELKVPSAAHKAIAQLVAGGYVRVIVTTNFDRLLEQALEAAGVMPMVISSPDQARGAIPLTHSDCTVVKVHGDYMDTRIKNSPEELAEYDPAIDSLLDQILDEYGLIVCGWSAAYDTALRAAIERASNRRYSTFWCDRGSATPEAAALIRHRQAERIAITDADQFFQELHERVREVAATGRRHPLGTQAAVEALKRYIPDDREQIRLQELVRDATERCVVGVASDDLQATGTYTAEELRRRVARYEAVMEEPLALVANGASWGSVTQAEVWASAVRRLASAPVAEQGLVLWIGLARLPALACLYGIGIAATHVQRFETLRVVLVETKAIIERESEPLAEAVYLHSVLSRDQAQALRPPLVNQKHRTPLNDYIFDLLRDVFQDLIPSDEEYLAAFDRFEYLLALIQADLYEQEHGSLSFAEGAFGWRRDGTGEWWRDVVAKELESSGTEWAPLKAGLFQSSLDRLSEIKKQVDSSVRWGGFWRA